jgi:hypothetical protein
MAPLVGTLFVQRLLLLRDSSVWSTKNSERSHPRLGVDPLIRFAALLDPRVAAAFVYQTLPEPSEEDPRFLAGPGWGCPILLEVAACALFVIC